MSVSSNVEIMTTAELREYGDRMFQKGVERGRFEQRMDESRAKEPEANAGSADTHPLIRPAEGSSRPVDGRSSTATSDYMDVTAGETAPNSPTQKQDQAGTAEIIARTHRLVPMKNLSALFALLPPAPVIVNGSRFEYRDPNAAKRLLEIRSVFEALMNASTNVLDGLASPSASTSSPVGGTAGWKLVPIKPTQEMLKAAYDRDNDGTTNLYFKIWDAMLAVSPTPPAVSQAVDPTDEVYYEGYEEGRRDRSPAATDSAGVAPFADGGYGQRLTAEGEAYISEYEYDDYTPTDFERGMISDAFNGIMSHEPFFGIIRAMAEWRS